VKQMPPPGDMRRTITRLRPRILIGPRARLAYSDRRKKMPACGARLRPSETRHRPHQGRHRMERGQVDRKPACAELLVALRILDRGQGELFNPARFLALRLPKPVETVNKPPVG